jgi:hypothetical protein
VQCKRGEGTDVECVDFVVIIDIVVLKVCRDKHTHRHQQSLSGENI